MRTLCSAEISVLKKYGMLETVEINQEEYSEIKKSTPQYTLSAANGKLFKFVVPEYVTEETIEQLERAMSIDMQLEATTMLKNIQNDVSFFKTLTVLALIIAIIGVFASIF